MPSDFIRNKANELRTGMPLSKEEIYKVDVIEDNINIKPKGVLSALYVLSFMRNPISLSEIAELTYNPVSNTKEALTHLIFIRWIDSKEAVYKESRGRRKTTLYKINKKGFKVFDAIISTFKDVESLTIKDYEKNYEKLAIDFNKLVKDFKKFNKNKEKKA